MDMYQNLGNFLGNYGSPFFVGSLVEKKLLFVNKEAKKMFDCTEETCNFEKIFERTEERLESLIEKGLKRGGNSIFYNFIVNTGTQEKIVVDFQFGFFNDEKTEMFLEILPQQDTRLQMAKNQIQNSPRAEAILNFDENFSIVDCNEAFYKVFECNEELCHSHCKHDLANGFLPETRESLMGKIQETLKTSEIFSTETKILTADGKEKWYRCDLQKRELDSTGTKLICYMVDIEKQVELKKENHLLIQQFSAMQELTDDVLYHIDVDKDVFYHNVDFVRGKDKMKTFTNFENFFIEREIVHPEDTEKYLTYLKNWLSPDISTMECTLRFSITSMEYQWYTIRRKKICDENGVLTYILGALVNVQKEYAFKKENKTLNQYFDVLQTIPDESFYSVDVKNKTLTQTGKVAEELGLPEQTPNFPESVLYKVHPDDLEKYKNYSYSSMQGKSGQEDVRVQTKTGEYQWYRLQSEVVRDENGNIAEVVGKMNNIQKEKELIESYDSLNHIFTAMQELSDDILFRIDINENTFYHSNEETANIGIMLKTENYVETFIVNGNIHPDDVEHYRKCNVKLKTGELTQYEMRAEVEKGVYHAFDVKCNMIYSNTGEPLEIFGRMKNIQAQKDLEARASHDLMTQVLNKVSFEDTAATVLANSIQGFSHAIIFIDLDDFKGINDNLGHGFGDFLLTTVGKRLKRVVRESDLIGRLGGDEFAVMLKSIGSPEAAELRVKLLLDTLQRPFSFEGKTVEIKASIGFAIAPLHGNDYKKLIKKADIALYQSKGKGKNTATMYTEEIEEY